MSRTSKAMRCSARRGRTPIAVGENLHMSYAFENFIMRGAVDFIQPDVARAGGITEIRKITALAAQHKVPVSFHTWGDGVALAASVHLSAALERLHRDGARLHLQSAARRIVARAVQSAKRFSDPARKTRVWALSSIQMLLSDLLFPAAKISPFGRRRWQPDDRSIFPKINSASFCSHHEFDWTVR